MSKLQVSPEAQQDLLEIKAYITNDLENPTAARSTVSKITKRIRGLIDHPLMGTPLSSVCNADSNERFLVSGKYLIFYHVSYHGAEVYIDRVLYGGRDYLRILFEHSLEEMLSDYDFSDARKNPYSDLLPH